MKFKQARLFASFLLFISFSSFLVLFNSNFTGSWQLNLNKSEMGNIPVWAAIKSFSIKQNSDSIHITRIITDGNNNKMESQETVSLDGKSCTSKLSGNRIKKTIAKWSEDRNQLTLTSDYFKTATTDSVAYTIQMIFNLSNDQQEMKVRLNAPSYAFTTVYDKQ